MYLDFIPKPHYAYSVWLKIEIVIELILFFRFKLSDVNNRVSKILRFTLYRYVYWISHSRGSEITPKLSTNIKNSQTSHLNTQIKYFFSCSDSPFRCRRDFLYKLYTQMFTYCFLTFLILSPIFNVMFYFHRELIYVKKFS